MLEFRPHSFDTRGFVFALKCLAFVLILFTGVRYGTALAGERLFADSPTDVVAEAPINVPQEMHAEAPAPTPSLKNIPLPKVSATAYVVADINTGEIFAQRDADSAMPIASISKLLVALIAREVLSATTTVAITAEDRRATDGTPGSITRNESFTASDIFYALLMESNNSAAYALARTYDTDEFIRLMLRKAHEIGMDETLLDDSSGISEHNTASASDLLDLARYIYANDPGLFEITRTKAHTIVAESGRKYPLANFNHFAGIPEFVGGKTGFTPEAHQTMVSLFAIPGADATSTVAIIILGSQERKSDIEKLLKWYKSAAK